ncbi:MAG: response regulator transcription factor [Rhodospirillaceae bacterium]
MTKILVVDDELLMRKSLEKILSTKGYTIVTAANGQEGVETFKTEAPDLVLMDLSMPVMHGFDATKAIRATGSKVKILVLTAENQQANYEEVYAAGADGYMSKPVNFENLLSRIAEELG